MCRNVPSAPNVQNEPIFVRRVLGACPAMPYAPMGPRVSESARAGIMTVPIVAEL